MYLDQFGDHEIISSIDQSSLLNSGGFGEVHKATYIGYDRKRIKRYVI